MAPPFAGAAPGRSAGPDHILGIKHLVDCLQGRAELQLDIRQAGHVLRVLEAAAESSQRGRHVEID